MNKNSGYVGTHLFIDGNFDPDDPGASDVKYVTSVVDELVVLVEMEAVGPHICHRDASIVDGVTVTEYLCVAQTLSTSHMAFHLWPQKGALAFDLFSCKEFSPAVVENHVSRAFNLQHIRTDIMDRRWIPPAGYDGGRHA